MSLRNRNVLVTGGAGFIGSHLCEAIALERPRSLVVVDNLFLGRNDNLDESRSLFPGLKFYKKSICDYKSLKDIIRKHDIEVVFNLAVIPLPASLINPRMVLEENIAGVLNLCELGRQKYFKSLVHCSSSEAYGNAEYVPMDEKHPLAPTTSYAASKAAADQLCLSYAVTYGLDLRIARPFNNYGPRQNDGIYAGIIPIAINRAIARKPIMIYGDGRQTRDFIFVKDTARAILDVHRAKAAKNRIINIASGREISIIKLIALILDIMDSKVPTRHLATRPGDVRRHLADVNLAAKIIGFEPHVQLREGLEETVRWYKHKRGKR